MKRTFAALIALLAMIAGSMFAIGPAAHGGPQPPYCCPGAEHGASLAWHPCSASVPMLGDQPANPTVETIRLETECRAAWQEYTLPPEDPWAESFDRHYEDLYGQPVPFLDEGLDTTTVSTDIPAPPEPVEAADLVADEFEPFCWDEMYWYGACVPAKVEALVAARTADIRDNEVALEEEAAAAAWAEAYASFLIDEATEADFIAEIEVRYPAEEDWEFDAETYEAIYGGLEVSIEDEEFDAFDLDGNGIYDCFETDAPCETAETFEYDPNFPYDDTLDYGFDYQIGDECDEELYRYDYQYEEFGDVEEVSAGLTCPYESEFDDAEETNWEGDAFEYVPAGSDLEETWYEEPSYEDGPDYFYEQGLYEDDIDYASEDYDYQEAGFAYDGVEVQEQPLVADEQPVAEEQVEEGLDNTPSADYHHCPHSHAYCPYSGHSCHAYESYDYTYERESAAEDWAAEEAFDATEEVEYEGYSTEDNYETDADYAYDDEYGYDDSYGYDYEYEYQYESEWDAAYDECEAQPQWLDEQRDVSAEALKNYDEVTPAEGASSACDDWDYDFDRDFAEGADETEMVEEYDYPGYGEYESYEAGYGYDDEWYDYEEAYDEAAYESDAYETEAYETDAYEYDAYEYEGCVYPGYDASECEDVYWQEPVEQFDPADMVGPVVILIGGSGEAQGLGAGVARNDWIQIAEDAIRGQWLQQAIDETLIALGEVDWQAVNAALAKDDAIAAELDREMFEEGIWADFEYSAERVEWTVVQPRLAATRDLLIETARTLDEVSGAIQGVADQLARMASDDRLLREAALTAGEDIWGAASILR